VFDFTNKVAVVTGSSRSIGRSIALALARCGCAVTINYSKSRDEAEEVVNTIMQMGGKAIAVKCDVSKREEVENLFSSTRSIFSLTMRG
jgi:3-oxoacyl-[acyl-carrier protein] reductase